MRFALASSPVKNRNMAFNVQSMVDAIENCSGKADLILFGESVLQGFDSLCWDYERDKRTAVALTDPAIQRMRDAARGNATAVSFGFIERVDDALYSSQIFIGADGEIVNVFHRVSAGWKEYWQTDDHYREGQHFNKFYYGGKSFAIGLCGDLWTEGRPEEMKALNADVVLWPVCCGYSIDEWNNKAKYEYAEQAALCGDCVLFVDPTYADQDTTERTTSAAIYFKNGKIEAELPAGESGILIVEI